MFRLDVFKHCYGLILTPDYQLGNQSSHDNKLDFAVYTTSLLAA